MRSSWASSPRAPAGIVAVIIGSCAATSWFFVSQRFWIDDAFISFRYAHNLVQGHGLVYNPGERLEGYTNFLWTVMSAFALWCGAVSPMALAQGVSLLAQAGTLVLVYRLGLGDRARPHRALLAPALLALHASFLVYPMSGMETSTVAFLVTLGAALGLREEDAHPVRDGLGLGVVLLSISLMRFDGALVAVLLLGCAVAMNPWSWRARTTGVVLIAGLGAYNLGRLIYYPTVLPHTFYAKVSFSPVQLWRGLTYEANFALSVGVLPVLLAGVPLLVHPARRRMRLLACVIAAHLAYVCVVGGDWMPRFRFVLPILPLLVVLTQEGFWTVLDRFAHLRPRLRARSWLGVLILLPTLAALLFPIASGRLVHGVSAAWFDPHDAHRIGNYLDRALAPEAVVAVEWGGIVPFHARQRFIETWGITDAHIVQQGFPATRFGRRITPEYLAGRRPAVVVPCARLFATEDAARASTQANGACHYGFYLSLAEGPSAYVVRVLKVGEAAYWPAVVRSNMTVRPSSVAR